MIYKKIFSILFSLLLSLQILVSQPLTEKQVNELSEVVSQEQLESGAPGAVFAIAQNDKIIFQKAFGVTNIATQQPMTAETVFPIASVTKLFTALALLKSMEEKDLDINTTVGSLIEGLPEKLSSLTVHHLLSHSAGMINWWPNKNTCKPDVYEYFMSVGDNALFEDQGKVFSYSNNGYALAGLLLSTLEEIPYTDAVNKLVLEPLQMNASTFWLNEAVTNSLAIGHSENEETKKMYPSPTGITDPRRQAEGGLYSNIPDLSKLAVCFMNDGIYNNEQLISPSIIEKMSEGYSHIGAVNAFLSYPNSKYSYGTYVFERNGIDYVANGGETGNTNTLFVMAPKEQTAFIVLSNAGYHPFAKAVEKAMEIMFPNQIEKPMELVKANYEELIGKYYFPNVKKTKDDIVEIKKDNDEIQLHIPPDETFPLIHSGTETYTYYDPAFTIPLEITFFRDEKGEVKYVNIFWRTYIKIE